MELPEGLVILVVLFGFPYLIARKNVFNTDYIIHGYMDMTERHILLIIKQLYILKHHATAFYKHHI